MCRVVRQFWSMLVGLYFIIVLGKFGSDDHCGRVFGVLMIEDHIGTVLALLY